MSDTNPPLCKDCRWVKQSFMDFGSYRFARCAHPSTTDLVSGQSRSFCSVQRMSIGLCGETGKNFEPKRRVGL